MHSRSPSTAYFLKWTWMSFLSGLGLFVLMTFLGRNLWRPTSFSKYSKLDFLSRAMWGMSLKQRLCMICRIQSKNHASCPPTLSQHFWGQAEGCNSAVKCSVSEPYSLYTDPDPAFKAEYPSGFGFNPDPIQGFDVQKLDKIYG
jgi:hypothetical protein